MNRTIADELLVHLGNADSFFRETVHRRSGRPQINPKAKLLLCLKVLAFGVSPMAFLDFFQMGERTALDALGKFCQIITTSDLLRSLYLSKMTRADAKRVSEMHNDRYGVERQLVHLARRFWLSRIVEQHQHFGTEPVAQGHVGRYISRKCGLRLHNQRAKVSPIVLPRRWYLPQLFTLC